ncbi:MAG: ATP-binding cassette domain-containing protein, partial [Ruthenibacterium sp.]
QLATRPLAKMGLGKRAHHKPTEMSGGQQQRVGIARAFVAKPKVIFADEPTGNLDSHTTAKVMNAILTLARENDITFVMVTHERDLSGCADRIITLKDGLVLRDEKIDHPNRVFEVQLSPMDAEYAAHGEHTDVQMSPENTAINHATQTKAAHVEKENDTEVQDDENQPVAELPLSEQNVAPLNADEYLP